MAEACGGLQGGDVVEARGIGVVAAGAEEVNRRFISAGNSHLGEEAEAGGRRRGGGGEGEGGVD